MLVGSQDGKYPDGNSVVVRGSSATAVIDPSLSVAAAADRGEPLEVDLVLLTHTHEDHAAGIRGVRHEELHVHERDVAAARDVAALMDLYGVPDSARSSMTAMVRDQFGFVGWPEARAFAAGQVFDLGGVTVRAVHAPGHTAGHTVFLVEPDGVLVTGDIDLSSFGPYYGDAASSLDDFESTLVAVREIPAEWYVTFHHKGVVTGHAAFAAAIDAYASVIDRRSAALLALLPTADAAPRSLDALVAHGIVYRPGTRPAVFGDSVEQHTIERHLQRLCEQGLAVERDDQGWARA